MCAFCGESVESGAVDPCSFITVRRWDRKPQRSDEQQFFTHAECLLARMHPDVAAEAGRLRE